MAWASRWKLCRPLQGLVATDINDAESHTYEEWHQQQPGLLNATRFAAYPIKHPRFRLDLPEYLNRRLKSWKNHLSCRNQDE